MEKNNQSSERVFSISLESTELQEILSQLDAVLIDINQKQTSDHHNNDVNSEPSPVGNSLISLSDWLKMSSAPLRPSIIGGLRGFIWRILNIPVRLFIPTQIGFNNNLRVFIGELISELRNIHASNEILTKRVLVLEENNEVLIQAIEKTREVFSMALEKERGILTQLVNENQKMVNALNTLTEMNKKVEEQLSTMKSWMNSQDERLTGDEKWIQLIGMEMRNIALETRALKNERAPREEASKIIKPTEIAQKILNQQEKVRLNLGSGNKLEEGYINVDFRELPGVELVSEVDDLPFPHETVDEIASSHLIEHFHEYTLTTRLLPHWYSLLKKGGLLRIICPNWKAMLKMLNEGTLTLAEFKILTFGGQDYDGNDHFSMYTPESLSDILLRVGFTDLEVITEDRDNGGCPEMELVATKPLQADDFNSSNEE